MKLYRFVDCGTNKLFCEEYDVLRETAKGYWIAAWHFTRKGTIREERWVSKYTYKRFAYPTQKEALISYTKRRECYIKHLKRNMARAEQQLAVAKQLDLSIKLITYNGGIF